jgi:hypothetical protein
MTDTSKPELRNDLIAKLRELKEAAHSAIKAGNDTTTYPMLNREKLRQIARLTDEMDEQPMLPEGCHD